MAMAFMDSLVVSLLLSSIVFHIEAHVPMIVYVIVYNGFRVFFLMAVIFRGSLQTL